jgi:hypothetical protein
LLGGDWEGARLSVKLRDKIPVPGLDITVLTAVVDQISKAGAGAASERGDYEQWCNSQTKSIKIYR